MIDFYQSMIGLEIDASFMARLCKDIADISCEGGACLFFGNSSMGNKEIQIHMPSHHTLRMIPHCTVTCKTCKHVKRVDIYSFTVLSKEGVVHTT